MSSSELSIWNLTNHLHVPLRTSPTPHCQPLWISTLFKFGDYFHWLFSCFSTHTVLVYLSNLLFRGFFAFKLFKKASWRIRSLGPACFQPALCCQLHPRSCEQRLTDRYCCVIFVRWTSPACSALCPPGLVDSYLPNSSGHTCHFVKCFLTVTTRLDPWFLTGLPSALRASLANTTAVVIRHHGSLNSSVLPPPWPEGPGEQAPCLCFIASKSPAPRTSYGLNKRCCLNERMNHERKGSSLRNSPPNWTRSEISKCKTSLSSRLSHLFDGIIILSFT